MRTLLNEFQPETGQRERDLRFLEFVSWHSDGVSGARASVVDSRELCGGQGPFVLTGEPVAGSRSSRFGRACGERFPSDGRRAEAVAGLLERRRDKGRRRAACRQQLLTWLNGLGAVGTPSRVSRANFDGSLDLLPFTDAESGEASNFLHDNELIASVETAQGGHTLLWLTRLGRDCVDSPKSVEAFLEERSRFRSGHALTVTDNSNVIVGAFGDRKSATPSRAETDDTE